MYESEWASVVHAMLIDKPANITYQEIADRAGLDIGFIKTFAAGSIKNPTITRVEKLYNTLKEIKAEQIAALNSGAWGQNINVSE